MPVYIYVYRERERGNYWWRPSQLVLYLSAFLPKKALVARTPNRAPHPLLAPRTPASSLAWPSFLGRTAPSARGDGGRCRTMWKMVLKQRLIGNYSKMNSTNSEFFGRCSTWRSDWIRGLPIEGCTLAWICMNTVDSLTVVSKEV